MLQVAYYFILITLVIIAYFFWQGCTIQHYSFIHILGPDTVLDAGDSVMSNTSRNFLSSQPGEEGKLLQSRWAWTLRGEGIQLCEHAWCWGKQRADFICPGAQQVC